MFNLLFAHLVPWFIGNPSYAHFSPFHSLSLVLSSNFCMSVFYLFSEHSKDEKIIFYASFYSLQFWCTRENAFQIFFHVSPLSYYPLVVVAGSPSIKECKFSFWSALRKLTSDLITRESQNKSTITVEFSREFANKCSNRTFPLSFQVFPVSQHSQCKLDRSPSTAEHDWLTIYCEVNFLSNVSGKCSTWCSWTRALRSFALALEIFIWKKFFLSRLSFSHGTFAWDTL